MSNGLIENLEVRKYLPHRYPFLLVDKIVDVKPGESLTAIKCVTTNEPFFTGHMPNVPIMPGVLMIEALAQTGGILIYKTLDTYPTDNELFFLAGVDDVRFKTMVTPGDRLELHVEILRQRPKLWKFKGVATVDGQVACSAEFLLVKAPALSLDG